MKTLMFVLLCATSLLAQDSSDAVKSKIMALEKAWNQAYKMGDVRALNSLLDDHIVLINDDGSSQSKDEWLKSVKATNSQEQQVSPESPHAWQVPSRHRSPSLHKDVVQPPRHGKPCSPACGGWSQAARIVTRTR